MPQGNKMAERFVEALPRLNQQRVEIERLAIAGNGIAYLPAFEQDITQSAVRPAHSQA
jgi:hypothetical protein